jgi:4-diphosphocytidyl-2-C-methyl-D-erythritol kinase
VSCFFSIILIFLFSLTRGRKKSNARFFDLLSAGIPMAMRKIVSLAPAKINLHLAVSERREDGYHTIESIFWALDLSDTLVFELGGKRTVARNTLTMDVSPLPRPSAKTLARMLPARNIVLKAVKLFRRKTGFDRPVKITLTKRIPCGAGLGGGSSDAAATLRSLDALAGTKLPPVWLREWAAALGSDVPFFLSGSDCRTPGAAFVSGRGEVVREIAAPAFPVVLVNPLFSSDTGEAFTLLDEARPQPPQTALGAAALEAALQGPVKTWPFFNDFLPVFLARGGRDADAYRRALDGLREAGAAFAGLSGSGATCFGVFEDEATARDAAATLKNDTRFVYLANGCKKKINHEPHEHHEQRRGSGED